MDTNDTQTRAAAPSVGKAWTWALVFTGVMTVLGFTVWDSLSAAPSWFHALFGFQLLWAVAGIVNAHKKRAVQTPE